MPFNSWSRGFEVGTCTAELFTETSRRQAQVETLQCSLLSQLCGVLLHSECLPAAGSPRQGAAADPQPLSRSRAANRGRELLLTCLELLRSHENVLISFGLSINP